MKKVIAILGLCTACLSAQAAEICNFNSSAKTTGELSIEAGLHGGAVVGVAKVDGKTVIVSDKIQSFEAVKKDFSDLNNKTGAIGFAQNLKINLKKVASIKVTTLELEKNADDLSGASIVTFLDAKNKIITRLGQIGWGMGICK